jgi:alcohol dehydrogenase
MLSQFHNPVNIQIGPVSDYLMSLGGKKTLLVTTDGAVRRGLFEKLGVRNLPENFCLWSDVTPNPTIKQIEAARRSFNDEKIERVLAIGGGSVLDTGKALAVLLANPTNVSLEAILKNSSGGYSGKTLPLIAVPTTAGTGSEVTPFATIWDDIAKQKKSLFGVPVFPQQAVIDSSLLPTDGDEALIYPALDSVSHALESLWNRNRNQFSEIYAARSLEIANQILPCLKDGQVDDVVKEQLHTAAVMSGVAISVTRTAIAHSISYPLTSHFGAPHGLACSFTLPRLIDHHLDNAPEEEYRSLFLKTKKRLQAYDLDGRLKKYTRNENILIYADEMLDSSRATNFVHANVCIEDLIG